LGFEKKKKKPTVVKKTSECAVGGYGKMREFGKEFTYDQRSAIGDRKFGKIQPKYGGIQDRLIGKGVDEINTRQERIS